MKRNKFLMAIVGVAILSGVLFSGAILATGIQRGMADSAQASSAQRGKQLKPYLLEKTRLDDFSEISIDLSYSNVTVIPSDGYYLEYRLDGTHQEPVYGVSNGKFYFQEGNLQRQFQISWNLFGALQEQEPFYLNLYVPKESAFDAVAMDLESGNLELGQMEAKKASFALEYGNFTSDTLTGGEIAIRTESGNVEMGDVACEKLKIQAEYGNVTGGQFTISRRADFSLDSGNLELSKLSGDSFKLSNAYGNCTVDTFLANDSSITMDSGCLTLLDAAFETTDIRSEYGDTEITLADGTEGYNYNVETEYGTVSIDGKTITAEEDGNVTYHRTDEKINKRIQIQGESGNIRIR